MLRNGTEALEAFVDQVVADLAPEGTVEHAEAHHIAGRYWRRLRLLRFEALVMAHVGTPSPMQVADERTRPFAHPDTEPAEGKGAARVVGSELLEGLPRHEAHLSREPDRALTGSGSCRGGDAAPIIVPGRAG